MWKKEDSKPEGISGNIAAPANSAPSSSTALASAPAVSVALPSSSRAAACISQGIKIKGEVMGSEDLFVDGVVEGKLSLTTNSCLTIGPNGSVKADVIAREVIVRGKVEAGRQPNKLSEIKASAATATGKTADSTSLNSGTAAD